MGADPLFGRLAIIGAGLIGSSIARIARARTDIAAELVIADTNAATRARVTALNLADHVTAQAAEAVQGADLVALCTPVGTYAALAETIGPRLGLGAILMDVGSTKGSVIRDVAPHVPPHAHFVPAHPLAGTEYSGPDAGFATLFTDRWCVLTPSPGTDRNAVDRVAELWRRCGAMVEEMEAAHHDRVLAITSHLPHLIAFTICSTADDLTDETRGEVLRFAASGFRDFTRIAASDPVMWRDVFLNNREAVLEMLTRFSEDVQAMGQAIRRGDAAFIEAKVEHGRHIRRSLLDLKQA